MGEPKYPTYGTTKNYLDEQGEDYFRSQKIIGQLGAKWNLQYFQPNIEESDVVLDFGCGGGFLLNEINCAKKIGVEINPAAQKQAADLGLKVYTSLEEVGENVTKIISSHALEHVPSPLIVLKKMFSVLNDSGKLVMLLPMEDWRSSSQRRFSSDDFHHHLYTWTPRTLANLLIEAKFHPLSVEVITDAMPPRFAKELLGKYSLVRPLIGYLSATLLIRRQLFAIAKKAE